MARFYANENFPRPVVDELRKLGHDVLTVLETGKAGISWSDQDVLRFAATEQRILLTMNRRHFRRLHDDGEQHSGIVLCTVDLDFIGQAGRIHNAAADGRELAGRVVAVNRPNRR